MSKEGQQNEPKQVTKPQKPKASFSAKEIESRYQEHLKRVAQGGKCNA